MPTHFHTRTLTAMAGAVAAGALTLSVAATGAPAVGHPMDMPGDHHGDHHSRDSKVTVERLVADRKGEAQLTDPNLVNPWGLASSPTSPLWVANNGTSTSTLYTGATSHRTPVTKVPLDVSIPGSGSPTGMVFNPTKEFVLHKDKTGPATFIFAGEDGDLFAWNPSGDRTKAVQVAHADHTIYKGLAMTTVHDKPFLLATDFHNNRINIFDRNFHPVRAHHAFRSKDVPKGYAPFGIANLNGLIYVTYAQQDKAGEDDVPGPGHGFVNVFDQRGRFLEQLVSDGVLDSPWGLAIAPQGFGRFAGKLLIGNFGDGRIHVVDPRSGDVLATLLGRHRKPIEIDGLWGLLPGNGTAGGRSDVWFSAGPDDESHGLLGILRTSSRHSHR